MFKIKCWFDMNKLSLKSKFIIWLFGKCKFNGNIQIEMST